MLGRILMNKDTYQSRVIGRTEVLGLDVSTAYTFDCGYETAIIDKLNVYVVERYETKEDAERGHLKWCKEALTIETVTSLTLPIFKELVGDREIYLMRNTKQSSPKQ